MLALLAPAASQAQQTAKPTGAFTPGHALRANTPSGSPYSDAGGAAGSDKAGSNSLSEIGITAPGMPFCINDGLINSLIGYHRLCLGHDTSGNMVINADAIGTGAKQAFFILNGTKYEMPFVIGGIAGPVTTVVGDAAVWNNGQGTALADAGAPPVLTVPTLAALKLLAGAPLKSVVRLGHLAPGDAGSPVTYNWSTAACTLNAGAGDNGWQVDPSAGGVGCWVAQLSPQGTGINLWGKTGTANDTPLMNAADTAMGASDWPAGASKTLFIPRGNTNITAWQFSHIEQIVGADKWSSVIHTTAISTAAEDVIQYTGAGPITIRNLAVRCPYYNQALIGAPSSSPAYAGPPGARAIDIRQTGLASAQASRVTVQDVTIAGCGTHIRVSASSNVLISNIDSDQAYGWGIIVTTQADTLVGAGTQEIYIDHVRCRAPGAYCVSLPVAETDDQIALAAREIHVTNVVAFGCGFIYNAGCFDFTGSAMDHFHADVDAASSWGGAGEAKRIFANVNINPARFQNMFITARYTTHFDLNTGFLFPHELQLAADLDDEVRNLFGDVYVSYSIAGTWSAATRYAVGDVRRTVGEGNTYIALTAGVSGSGEPTGTGRNITDGSVHWYYVAPTGTGAAANIQACTAEAIAYAEIHCHAQRTAYGWVTSPRGGATNVMRNVSLHFDGNVEKSCLTDVPISPSDGVAPYIGTYSGIRLINFDCRVTNGFGVFIGADDADGHYNSWDHLVIKGGHVSVGGNSSEPLSFGEGGDTGSSSVTAIIDGLTLEGGRSGIAVHNTISIRWIGGAIIDSDLGEGGFSPISNYAPGTGTFNVIGAPMAILHPTNNVPAWKIVSGTLSVSGRFMRPPAGAAPAPVSGGCAFGEIIPSAAPGSGGQPIGGWACTDTTTGTWTDF